MARTDLGKVAIRPRGVYDVNAEYEKLDVIRFGDISYIVLRPVQGVTPAEGEYYMEYARSVYYVPEITADGYLRWSNNGGRENPEPVDLLRKAEFDKAISGAEAATENANNAAAGVIADTATGLSQIQQASAAAQEDVIAQAELVKQSIPADYTALSASVDKIEDDYAPAIVESAEGEVVVVEDSAERRLKGLRVFGRTEQVTTTGKNLFYADINKPVDMSYVTENGESRTRKGFEIDLVAGTYTASVSGAKTVSGKYLYGKIVDRNRVTKQDVLLIQNYLIRPVTFSITDGDILLLFNALNPSTDEGVTELFSAHPVQIEAGSVATAYEPYTGGAPSPSPDYPQALNSVGDDGAVEVTAAGRNLLGLDDFNDASGSSPDSAINGVYTRGVGNATGYYNTYLISSRAFDSYMHYPKLIPASYVYSVEFVKFEGNIKEINGAYVNIVYADGTTDKIHNGVPKTLTKTATIVDFRCDQYQMLPGDSYSCRVQLEINSDPTAYEPYKPTTPVTLTTPNGLPGIPVGSDGNYTDADGQQWVCDEVDLERGVYVQRTRAYICDGTEAIANQEIGGFNRYRITPSESIEKEKSYQRGLCTHFVNDGTPISGNYRDKRSGIYLGNIYVRCDTYGTVEEFKEFLMAQYGAGTPISFVYPIDTPIETPLTASEIAAYKAMLSRKPTTTVYNDAGAHMAVDYVADTKTWINNKIAALSSAIVNNA